MSKTVFELFFESIWGDHTLNENVLPFISKQQLIDQITNIVLKAILEVQHKLDSDANPDKFINHPNGEDIRESIFILPGKWVLEHTTYPVLEVNLMLYYTKKSQEEITYPSWLLVSNTDPEKLLLDLPIVSKEEILNTDRILKEVINKYFAEEPY